MSGPPVSEPVTAEYVRFLAGPYALVGYSFGCTLLTAAVPVDRPPVLVLVAPTVGTHNLDPLANLAVSKLVIAPHALAALCRLMTDRQREDIRGVHYGGMSMTAATVNEFRGAFPNAVHLAGYGNTLFGVVMEVEDQLRVALDYFPLRDRLRFHVVCPAAAREDWPPPLLAEGETGRVLFHRLDESTLLIGVVERDEAEMVAPSPAAAALGAARGLRNPRPPAALGPTLQLGLY